MEIKSTSYKNLRRTRMLENMPAMFAPKYLLQNITLMVFGYSFERRDYTRTEEL